MITFPDDVLASYDRSKNYIRKTPIEYSASLSELINGEVYLKLENVQKWLTTNQQDFKNVFENWPPIFPPKKANNILKSQTKMQNKYKNVFSLRNMLK